MLARVAENVYWLSRYLERAQSSVRLVREHNKLLMDLPAVDEHDGWNALIAINGQEEEFNKRYGRADEQSVTHFLLSDADNPSSLLNAFTAIRVNLRSCRDILPKFSYEAINSLCRYVIGQVTDAELPAVRRTPVLHTIEERLLAVAGGLHGSMSHDIGYTIMQLGVYLERADMTSRIIDVQSTRLSTPTHTEELMAIEARRWMSVLRTASAHQMYRQHVRRPVNGPDTLAFLLTNSNLPRSYYFCLTHLQYYLRKLPNNDHPRQAVTHLQQQLGTADMLALAQDPVQRHQFIDDLQLGIMTVGSAIASTYFPPAQENE